MTITEPAPADGRHTKTVPVDLGSRSYNILIGPGLIDQAAPLIRDAIGLAANEAIKCAIVTDENVAAHHLSRLKETLNAHNMFAGEIILPPGEATKSFASLEHVSQQLLKMGIERGDLVIAFGGGVIGDLAGFAASILRRGIRFIQIPTSLLAQVDSSVGGKTGINTPQGKNLIGTFHQPNLVIADTAALATLEDRQMRAGYAEVAKYGLISDPQFFTWLEDNWSAIFTEDGPARAKAIETSCKAKAKIVAQDEREGGIRALLNLGHTFGHALEAWAGFSDKLLHGEAISIGMTFAFEFSQSSGLCPESETDRVRKHFATVGLPTKIAEIRGDDKPTAEQLMTLMAQDKKVKQGQMTFILTRGIGKAFITSDVDETELRTFLNEKTI